MTSYEPELGSVPVRTRQIISCSVVFISLVAAIGLSLALQGWNSRNTYFDLLPHMDDARAFIIAGRIPEKGTLTSFASYMAPRNYLVNDSRSSFVQRPETI